MKIFQVIVVFILITCDFLYARQTAGKFKLIGATADIITFKPLSGVSVIVISKISGEELIGVATDAKGNFTIENI